MPRSAWVALLGEWADQLGLEVGRVADQRVIDAVLGELQLEEHLREEEIVDVAAAQLAAQVGARAIEDAGLFDEGDRVVDVRGDGARGVGIADRAAASRGAPQFAHDADAGRLDRRGEVAVEEAQQQSCDPRRWRLFGAERRLAGPDQLEDVARGAARWRCRSCSASAWRSSPTTPCSKIAPRQRGAQAARRCDSARGGPARGGSRSGGAGARLGQQRSGDGRERRASTRAPA